MTSRIAAALLVLLFAFILPISRALSGRPLFETDCSSTADWEFLDIGEGARLSINEDPTVPRGYGPNVLKLSGREILLMVRDLEIREGTILVLWKDDDPVNRDADGVILFQAEYPRDLTVARNTQQRRPHCWVEQDSDAGFQIRQQLTQDDERTICEKAGSGRTQDKWNQSGWIWQKLSVRNGMLKAKYWSSVEPEPESWQIEKPGWEPKKGRVGLRIWTGEASIAYFAVTATEDLHPVPPPADILLRRRLWFDDEIPGVKILLNLRPDQPVTRIRLAARSSSGSGTSREIQVPLPAGHTEIDFPPDSESDRFPFPDSPTDGHVILSVQLFGGSGRLLDEATRTLEIRSRTHFVSRFQSLETRIESFVKSASPEDRRYLEAVSARNLLNLAKKTLSNGDISETDRLLGYAEEALDPHLVLCRYGVLPSQSIPPGWVMGQSYEVPVHIRVLSGTPETNLVARLAVTDDLCSHQPVGSSVDLSPADWKSGHATVIFKLAIPEEFPKGRRRPIEKPAVREGIHRLWFSLFRKGENEPLWLDSPNPDRGGFHQRYEVGRVTITQNPISIMGIRMLEDDEDRPTAVEVILQNTGDTARDLAVSCRVFPETGDAVWETVRNLTVRGNETSSITTHLESFAWWGPFQIKVEVLQEGQVLTTGTRSVEVPIPEGWKVSVSRGNEVWNRKGRPYTVIRGELRLPMKAGASKNARLVVGHEGVVYGSLERSLQPGITNILELGVLPAIGSYEVTLSVNEAGGRTFSRRYRLPAPVFETKEEQLYLNGEPFIVKGVNCHSLLPRSPRRTRLLMRLLKEIGFNMLRGDYPPLWQIDMAEQENLGYLVLAPFSVTNTDALKERYDPHAFARMREITRRFIRAYRDKPATWFWNSCNEVTREVDALLTMFYPLYKSLDPYNRPVVYANLNGQSRTIGQDMMGINYYYGPSESLASRQVMIRNDLKNARTAGIPCIFNEYNCWYGPVYSEGTRAVRGLFEFGLSEGMAGGFFYQLREQRPRHPGIVADDDTLWTNPSLIGVLRQVFDDADIRVKSRNPGRLVLEIVNVRPFTLRKGEYEIRWRQRILKTGSFDQLRPEESLEVEISNQGAEGRHLLEADLRFVTHYGIRERVSKRLYLE